jgi:predicted transcriptional regulator
MTEHVTAAEIADLMQRIRHLHEQRPADPREQAALLARKAELLARIADQRADEWGPCDYTTEAREIASEAQAIAENARRLARTGGAKSQENPPPF